MKFLVDAHLPRQLRADLTAAGHDAIHTLDLPAGNATADSEICERSLAESRVVISKDNDFFYSHVLRGRPWKLLLIRTGNISTNALCLLLAGNLQQIIAALEAHSLVEVDRSQVRPVV